MSGHHAALVPRFLAFLGAAVLVAVSLCGCGAFQMPRVAGGWVTPHRDPPSVLAVVLNVRSQAALATFRGLVTATARTGEHLIVLSAANGASLGTFAAPVMPRVAGPAWPAPLRPGATAFERASYRNAVTRAKGIDPIAPFRSTQTVTVRPAFTWVSLPCALAPASAAIIAIPMILIFPSCLAVALRARTGEKNRNRRQDFFRSETAGYNSGNRGSLWSRRKPRKPHDFYGIGRAAIRPR